MKIRIVCLANSFKTSGRCLAGIQLDSANKPLFDQSRPKWIRPTCNFGQTEVPTSSAEPFELLDVIEFEAGIARPEGHQSENVHFDLKSLRKVGEFPHDDLGHICDNSNMLFGNIDTAVSEEEGKVLKYSLMLIRVSQFGLKQVPSFNPLGNPKTRGVFRHSNTIYDLPVTDPNYQVKNNCNLKIDQGYLCLSLGMLFSNRYYKLIAGVLQPKSNRTEQTVPDADIPF